LLARTLERMGDAEEKSFVGDAADELQADGQAVRRKTTGDGDGGKAGQICGAIVAEKQSARWMRRAYDGGGFLADERSGNRRCGDDKCVETGIGHRGMKAADEGFSHLQRAQIRCGENLGAQFETSADIFAVVGGA